MRPEHREQVLTLVKERVFEEVVQHAPIDDEAANRKVETVLVETIFLELERLEKEPRNRQNRREHAALIEKRRKLFPLSALEKRRLLAEFIEGFANEVVGTWNESVYKFATTILPISLSALLNALTPRQLLRNLTNMPSIDDRLIIDGERETVQGLYQYGNLIFAPTHLSNLDSIVLGYGFYAAGLPPVTYGAGLNLFTNPMISYFMRNLGAYKVDRKKKSSLYKSVLKEYATITLEFGYPNLFFPGGTRCRSGAVEDKLKLGLLGCGLTAYIKNLQEAKPKPNIYIVPIILSYQLVLEAENLIDDYLKEVGQSRSIISDDEFRQPKRILDFITSLFELDSKIYMTFGQPMDCFGNRVGKDGRSFDKHGRPIDTRRYVVDRDDKPVHDEQRDQQYTREVAQVLVQEYKVYNTVMSTHILAFVVFNLMRRRHYAVDQYRFLRESRIDEQGLPVESVEAAVGAVHTRLLELVAAAKIRIDERLKALSASELLGNGLKHLGIYHTSPVVERRGDRVFVTDAKLLLYYRNRLCGYELEAVIPKA